MLPSIESLRCFASAARLLHFRAAARAVALTPAAFGQRIKQLEAELGTPLFVRTTRSVRLTEAGLALRPLADRALAAAAECVRVGRGAGAQAALELVLGTRHELGLSWLLPQLDALARTLPFVGLHLYFGSGADLVLRVRSMEIDCAIASTRVSDPKLDTIRLHREDYAFVGATALLAKTPLVRAEQARGHTLVDIDAELPLYRYFRDAPEGGDRLRFARLLRLGTIEAIRQRVLAGAGVAVLPRYLVERDLRARRLRLVEPRVKLLHDYFRLFFRADDHRRSVYEELARELLRAPLR
ncbi:MAG: LysR family transcriptional regulator [Polyangiaceae bacterium]|nr:LysR family transcriptional regulator [Polyangiaceae bacterium]